MNESDEKNNSKKTKSSRWLKIAGIVAIIILILLLLSMCHSKGRQEQSGGVTFGVIDLEDGQSNIDPQELANTIVDENQFQVFINTEMVVNDKQQADLLIQNSEANHYDCYVQLVENESGKTLYKSDILQPGFKIETDRLERKVPSGTHDCTAFFHVLDENGAEINQIGVEATITAR